ncbi:hypothetical protein ABIA39_002462 [Nocardia sp. GAS34]|uniref:DUF4267 domain-containing protein n=1 Tax=unclassified Nocardia TaxID=2637762 RepID=UPI003D207F39
MLTPIAYGLAILIDLLIIFVGLRFFLVPDAAAAAFGLPAESAGDAGPYLTVKGLRDFTSGVVGLVLLGLVGAHAEAWFMVAAALTPFGDAGIVLRNGGRKADAFGIHFATAVVVLISAVLLFLS